MTFEKIRNIARELGVKVVGVKKADIVKAIQLREGNEPCFASGRSADCGQPHCLWVKICD